jgi:hypothetical protein
MEIVPTCQSAFLFAAGHGLPWTAAILGNNKRTSEPNPCELGQEPLLPDDRAFATHLRFIIDVMLISATRADTLCHNSFCWLIIDAR